MSPPVEEEVCGFCQEVCTGQCSSYSVDGTVLFLFCRMCLDPELPPDEAKRRCVELIIILTDRAVDEAGNTMQPAGHA
jgi:hypothetical protein